MDNQVRIPILNPVNLVDKNRMLPANYHMKHFDSWLSHEQILENEQITCYCQKWQTDDIVKVQLKSTYDPIFVKVVNRIGVPVITQQMNLIGSIGAYNYFKNQIALDGLPEGPYKVYYSFGDPVQLILKSETWDIRNDHPGTVLMKYSNSFNNTILWQAQDYMTFRLDGVVAEYLPVAAPSRTVYIDQPGSAKTVKGNSARQFKLFTGNKRGMPPWMADVLEEIFDQTNVEIDGKGFSADVGAKLTPRRIQRYPWAQWELDIREALNRREKVFDTTGLLDRKVVIDYLVEGKLFGPLTPGGSANDNTYEITKVG